MSCTVPAPVFPSYIDVGIKNVEPLKDGYSVFVSWSYATPSISTNSVGYNVYFSTNMDDVFDEGPKYFTEKTSLNIRRFISGDMIYFAERATEYDPTIMDYNMLTSSPTAANAYIYPQSALAENITNSQLEIPLIDTNNFPLYGIIKVGNELIRYVNIDYNNHIVYGSVRGFYNTNIRYHTIDGYDGYKYCDPTVSIFKGFEDKNNRYIGAEPRFEKEEYPFTVQDGYKQVISDIVNTDLTASDESNINYPSYDYSGYHQTNIIDYFSGHCIGSYAGGEYGCDGYKVRGLNLQVENLKRQEMQLDVVGERVILLQRLWTGIRCNCFRINQEYADARCPNCFGTGFVMGYKQYHNPKRSDGFIMMKFDPTVDSLEPKPHGLQQNFAPNCWTTVIPAIKDRDVLIRFNEDMTEEYRYETLNVTRNKLLFSLSGAQKMQVYRLDKTDIIYQWRAFKEVTNTIITLNTTPSILRGYGPHMHTVIVRGDVTSINSINATTSLMASHEHPIINGACQEVLGHTHNIILS